MPRPLRDRRARLSLRLLRARQVRRLSSQLGQRPAAAARRGAQRFRRAHHAVRAAPVGAYQDPHRGGAGMSAPGMRRATRAKQPEEAAPPSLPGELAPGPLLTTTVIGSYAVPAWLGQLRNDWHQRRISGKYLSEITEMATKAAILDQEDRK